MALRTLLFLIGIYVVLFTIQVDALRAVAKLQSVREQTDSALNSFEAKIEGHAAPKVDAWRRSIKATTPEVVNYDAPDEDGVWDPDDGDWKLVWSSYARPPAPSPSPLDDQDDNISDSTISDSTITDDHTPPSP